MFAKTNLFTVTILIVLVLAAARCGAPQPELATQQETAAKTHEEEHQPTAGDHTAKMPALEAVTLADGEKLKVVATTSIVADVVKNIGGDKIDLTTLLPIGTDPHTFNPAPADLAAVADAHVVFANGMGLEEFLDEMVKNAGGDAIVIQVSAGVETRQLDEAEGEQHEAENHRHKGADPHTWTSPANVKVFVHNIEHTLSALDPANSEIFEAKAKVYEAQLDELDTWVKTQIDTIPAENRELVTDHTAFGYYADRYGLEQVGAVIPSFSSAAESSAKELANLEDAIKAYQVKAIFVGTSVNPSLSERVADDTGVKLVTLYTGSLGQTGSGVESYLAYIRYNTRAIVEALK
ncbi:MAG: zinc ABC transporter substrate-binding protein [Anaerolineae bacterium]|nr:zinc ABC transporter substrate-binding protein [Anaerolineae bacterium]